MKQSLVSGITYGAIEFFERKRKRKRKGEQERKKERERKSYITGL